MKECFSVLADFAQSPKEFRISVLEVYLTYFV